MVNHLPWPVKLLLAAVFVIVYYRYCKRWLFAAAQWLAQRVRLHNRYDRSEIGSVLELASAATSHVLVVFLLLAVTGVPFANVHLGPTPVLLVLLGALVGVGEMALSSFLCRLIIEASLWRRSATAAGRDPRAARRPARAAAPAAARAGGPADVSGWLAVGRGGWLRHHFKTLEVLPLPLAVLIMGLQVGSEEVVFRGVFLDFFRPSGFAVAFGASLLLFVAMQVFFMSSWRAAMFPVVGAVVMGVAQGLLAWQVPYLLPLVVAHVVFFLFAVI